MIREGWEEVLRVRSCEGFVQSLVHFLGRALEEASAAADEEGITSEDGALIAILEEVADAVLSVARRMQSLHFDAANIER